jgi:HD-GYP domain-containing protein (c-di-GMP phosphodiesterase class II)
MEKDIPRDCVVGRYILANLANLAQTLEVFLGAPGRRAAIEAVTEKRAMFSPELVKVAISHCKYGRLWEGLEKEDLSAEVMSFEPVDQRLTADGKTVDDICVAFAEIIDAKTPFTYQHSKDLADAAVDIGKWFAMGERALRRHGRRICGVFGGRP